MDWSIKQGAKITELRVKKGFTQDYVAKKIGVHPMAISQWERGKHAPSPHRIRDLAFLYNVTVEEIADDAEPEPAPDMEIDRPGFLRITADHDRTPCIAACRNVRQVKTGNHRISGTQLCADFSVDGLPL